MTTHQTEIQHTDGDRVKCTTHAETAEPRPHDERTIVQPEQATLGGLFFVFLPSFSHLAELRVLHERHEAGVLDKRSPRRCRLIRVDG